MLIGIAGTHGAGKGETCRGHVARPFEIILETVGEQKYPKGVPPL